MPRALVIAGPNGAGKTTFAREFLPNEGRIVQFVNADYIAAGISPFAPDTADVAAGRAMLRRLDELVAERVDFALETTLSGRWLLARIPEWKKQGYPIELHYLQLANPDQSLQRVRMRVQKGGHNIPESIIRRRFSRSLELLECYKTVVQSWIVFDNSGDKTVPREFGQNSG